MVLLHRNKSKLKVFSVLEMVLLVKEQILKKNILAKAFKEVMLVEFITQIKQELAGGKTVILNILQKY